MIVYGTIDFEWDDERAQLNFKKHEVTFEEASTAFYDPYALVRPDPDHSADEDRFVLLGVSSRARVPIACHCHRRANEVIRLISARKATKREESSYWRRRNEG